MELARRMTEGGEDGRLPQTLSTLAKRCLLDGDAASSRRSAGAYSLAELMKIGKQRETRLFIDSGHAVWRALTQ